MKCKLLSMILSLGTVTVCSAAASTTPELECRNDRMEIRIRSVTDPSRNSYWLARVTDHSSNSPLNSETLILRRTVSFATSSGVPMEILSVSYEADIPNYKRHEEESWRKLQFTLSLTDFPAVDGSWNEVGEETHPVKGELFGRFPVQNGDGELVTGDVFVEDLRCRYLRISN